MTLKTILTVAAIALSIARVTNKFPKKPRGPLYNEVVYEKERR